MKSSESNIVDIKCSSANIKEVKKLVYRGLDIYAVKRSPGSHASLESLYGLTAEFLHAEWWCGYVKVPADIHSLFKPRGYLDETVLDELDDPNKYNLASAHGGYTYIGYGIPLVLDNNQEVFLGWDYNHCYDAETRVTYNDVITEGKKVIDSMLSKVYRSEEKE